MKLPFRKKLQSKAAMAEFKKETIQEVEEKVHRALHDLGDLYHYKRAKQKEAADVADKAAKLHEDIDSLMEQYKKMRQAMQEEVNALIAKGKADVADSKANVASVQEPIPDEV